ncbi:MAG: LOG family protein [Desulfobulbaceae bacterium]|nr:LOG family protein [Desulfobulbaceae bacterium]
MKRSPLLTDDGYLVIRPEDEPAHDDILDAPRMTALLRFEDTSDTLRGVLHDLDREGRLAEGCVLIGRSGHSQVGLDVTLAGGGLEINTRQRRVDVPVVLTSLNRALPDIFFGVLKSLSDRGLRPQLARFFIPMSPPMDREEIGAAIGCHHLLLPEAARVTASGTIELPLENKRYLLSTDLFAAGQNAQQVLLQSKAGLSLIQFPSSAGLPRSLRPGEFLVGAVCISLGPYLAVIERASSQPQVFHLAARLLDAVRTSGIGVPRQVELYNGSEEEVELGSLTIPLRLYPADPATARVAERIFTPARAAKIIREGVDFVDVTDTFNVEECEALFDNLSATPSDRGNYARLLSHNRVVEIPRVMEEGEWHENTQNRVIYEVVRGRITSGVHTGDQIPPDLRRFVDSLSYVGGAQDLRQVYISHRFPETDTLRVLKRNNVGVFVASSLRGGRGVDETPCDHTVYFDQTTYETFCDLACKGGVRFYMLLGGGDGAQVREFYRNFWVTRSGREQLQEVHTVVAMFGSHAEGVEEMLATELRSFLAGVRDIPGIDGRLAVSHGAGPGIMHLADEVAESLGILRIGVGIDSEKVGQKSNLRPPVMAHFYNTARHLRQNILDRTSLCKIYNVGGMGTLEEMLIAITNLKLFESLPAPHIFVDPFGLGEAGGHLWQAALDQLRTAAAVKHLGGREVRLAPAWVPRFCHAVRGYDEALKIIGDFVRDPAAYWQGTGIRVEDLQTAFANARKAKLVIPPYLDAAMAKLTGRPE